MEDSGASVPISKRFGPICGLLRKQLVYADHAKLLAAGGRQFSASPWLSLSPMRRAISAQIFGGIRYYVACVGNESDSFSGVPHSSGPAVRYGAGDAMKMRGRFRLRPLTRVVARCLASMAISVLAVGIAHAACTCEAISPAQGFERAEYVFAGKVTETAGNTWTVDVDRVWKGSEQLAPRVRLLDVYAGIDCASYFEQGRSYLFFAIVAKSSRYVYYQSQVCNWTSALHSRRVPGRYGSVWLEEFIIENYGPGKPPTGEDPWRRRTAGIDAAPE